MSTERIDVEALRGLVGAQWYRSSDDLPDCIRLSSEDFEKSDRIVCEFPYGSDDMPGAADLIRHAPALLAEVIERRARDAAVAELVEASQSVLDQFNRADETDLDRYERVAAAFHADTGMLMPGKDQAAAAGGPSDHERFTAYMAWSIAKRDRLIAALAAVRGET